MSDDDQQDLFRRPTTAPYAPGSDTSHAAARSHTPEDLGTLRARVWAHVERCGHHGATCDEIERDLGLTHQTASARVNELVKAGRLVDSDERRKTRSGRNATVWVAVAR